MSNRDRLDPALHPVDGQRFGDPVAELTDWKPAHRGGANFRTHRMVHVEGRRIEFRPSHWSRLPNTIALLWGGGLLLALLADMTVAGDYTLVPGDGWAIAFASVCILFGWRSNLFRVQPAVFDLQSGLYWRGKRRPREPLSPRDLTRAARICDIHALQLVGERISGRLTFSGGQHQAGFTSFELNLVLKDATRINVVDESSLPKLRQEATELAWRLGLPLWDATLPPDVLAA